MPKLTIAALVEIAGASPGNNERSCICLAITDRDGKGVLGLTDSNFRVDSLLVAPGGSGVNIDTVLSHLGLGFYTLDIVPGGSSTWDPGVFILGVKVENEDDDGLKLVRLVME